MKFIKAVKHIRNRIMGLNEVLTGFDILQKQIDGFLREVNLKNEIENVNKKLHHQTLLIEDLHTQQNDTLKPFDISYTDNILEKVKNDKKFEVIEKISFLLHTAELVNHYAPVWNLLPKDSFEIVLYGDIDEDCLKTLLPPEVSIRKASDIIDANIKYRYLISNHPVNIELFKNLAEINIRFMYAGGKSKWNFSQWNDLYDVILCFGPYYAQYFSKATKALIVQMGYPRFDKYFSLKPDKAKLQKLYNCDPLKKTIVWLPTWKNLSSVALFDEEISNLTDNYNVVIKLHPLMLQDEPQKVLKLKKYRFNDLITDHRDNLPLYQLADFMLCDYGGPPFGAIYTDKNLILLNVANAQLDELTGSNSSDIFIRKYLINVNHEDKSILKHLNDETIWEQQKHIRNKLRKYYFAPYYGFSSKIAAETLLNMKNLI